MQNDLAIIISGLVSVYQANAFGNNSAGTKILQTLAKLRDTWPNMKESDKKEIEAIIEAYNCGFDVCVDSVTRTGLDKIYSDVGATPRSKGNSI